MVNGFKASILAVIALFVLTFSFNVRADDKKTSKCELCDEVKVVLESARCEKCQADKQCAVCEAHSKKAIAHYTCKKDTDKACEACEKALAANKCKFCAAKGYIVAHTFCCKNCEKAGEEKAQSCKKCQAQREAVEKIECKDHPNKK